MANARRLTLSCLAAALAAALSSGGAEARSDQYVTATRAPVRWRQAQVAFAVDPGMRDATLPDPVGVVGRAAASWQAVPSVPRFALRSAALGAPGYDSRRTDNVSGIVRYRAGLPMPGAGALGVTLATRNADTGEILDADVIVDATRYRFAVLTAGGLPVAGAPYDYQSVIAHELGHVLGLTEDPGTQGSMMFPTTRPGEAARRALHAEDVASLRSVYGATTTGGSGAAGAGGAVLAPGCGGAHVAPSGALASGRALCLVALGLLGLAAARTRWRRGRVLLAAGVLLALGAPSPGAANAREATVERAWSRYEGGVIVTRATLSMAGETWEVWAPGGRVGEFEQVLYDAPDGTELRPGATVDPARYFGD